MKSKIKALRDELEQQIKGEDIHIGILDIINRLDEIINAVNDMNPQSGYSAEQMKQCYKDAVNNVGHSFTLRNNQPLMTAEDYVASLPSPDLQAKYDRLKEAIESISSMKDDSGREGCTYGDTEYDSLSAVCGYNLAIDNIINKLNQKAGI